ncbi:hypothetical protein C8R45DRAFT_1132482 [Mycena sanguinolenta]|nr:hypothetical protein C8R45DRAFT_1132482 [Mycena sanguinolenta]
MSFNPNIVLGALLVGTWANSVSLRLGMFLRFEAIMDTRVCSPSRFIRHANYYYRHFKNDDWWLKLLVPSLIALDSVSMIANYASVYLYTIIHWGDFATKNKFITLLLFFFIVVAAGGAFAGGITLAIYPKYADREKATIPATTWLISEAVTDISIASALVWELTKIKSSIRETRSLINKLVTQAIQTGSAGATIALAALIAFFVNKNSNVPAGIAYVLSRIYCITTLANLNSRERGKTLSSWNTVSGANFETRGERSDGVIHVDVHRSAVVNVDTPQESSRGSFKTNPGQGLPHDSPPVEIEMADKKRDLFTA